MKFACFLSALIVLFAPAKLSAQPSADAVIQRIDGSAITTDSLTKKIRQLMHDAKVDGMQVVVFNDDKAIYKQAFGYANKAQNTPLSTSNSMYGASLSKAVFSTLVMKLVEQGKLDLDKPLQEYLDRPVYDYPAKGENYWGSDFSDLKSDTLYQTITARMCLSHTTGFANWRWFEPDQKLRIRFKPGSKFQYSGEGMGYLQFVIEHITGKRLNDLAQELIFDPAGMKQSGYIWNEAFGGQIAQGHDTNGKVYPVKKYVVERAGSTLQTTGDDYIAFLESLMHNKLVDPASLKEMFRPQIRIHSMLQFPTSPENDRDTYQNDHIQLSYGLGWVVFQTPFGPGAFKAGHGEGFQHFSIVFPERKVGMLILSNSDNAESIFKYLLENAIADTYTPWFWEKYIPYDVIIKF